MVGFRKIPKRSPGAYIFQRPFLRGLFLKGLVFGGAYLWREINCASLRVGRKFTVFALFYFVFGGISKYKLRVGGGLYLKGRFNGGFFALRVWGASTWRCLFSEFYCS